MQSGYLFNDHLSTAMNSKASSTLHRAFVTTGDVLFILRYPYSLHAGKIHKHMPINILAAICKGISCCISSHHGLVYLYIGPVVGAVRSVYNMEVMILWLLIG